MNETLPGKECECRKCVLEKRGKEGKKIQDGHFVVVVVLFFFVVKELICTMFDFGILSSLGFRLSISIGDIS